jgi:spore germination protein YaaH
MHVWFENAESLAYKTDIVNKWNLNGLALWRMGMEDPLAWDSIAAKVDAQK